jgi:hypothetical protein
MRHHRRRAGRRDEGGQDEIIHSLRLGLLQQRGDVRQVLDRVYADYALQRLGRLP